MVEGHRVEVYYQTQYDHSLEPTTPYGHYVSVLPLIGLITHLIVAAFHINANTTPYPTIALNDNDPDDDYYTQMWKEVGVLKSQGIKVMGMLGGVAPGTYECLTEDQFDTYYPKLAHYIKKYELDGMDLDVEQAVSHQDIVHLITRLRHDFGPDFIITLAPVASALLEGGNLSGFDYIKLEHDIGHLINWYNAQFYSGFGSLFPDDQYINITEYGPGPSRLSPSRLVATTLTNPDDGSGWIDPVSITASVKDLTRRFGGSFGGVAGWEYFNSIPDYYNGQPWKWAALMSDAMEHPARTLIRSRIARRQL